MTATAAQARRLPVARHLELHLSGAAVAAWLLPFALIIVLAFNGGGYDPVLRGQVGIAAWWVVVAGAVAGVLNLRHGRAGWVALVLLAAFLGWSLLGLTWTDSTERTVAEVGRLSTYLAILVLALGSQGRLAARHAVNGAACAIAIVGAAAVLSRLHPQWFGVQPVYEVFTNARPRLAYPLNYWNLLAGLVAMGIPLLLMVASTARTMTGRTLAAAALPVQGLCVYLTISRGGVGAVAAALLVGLLLAPNRLPRTALLAVVTAGTAILCVAADRRDDLQQNLETALRVRQGDELLTLTVIVCLGVGALALAIALADRHALRPAWTRVPVNAARVATVVAVALIGVAFLGAGGPGWLSHRVQEFKGQAVTSTAAREPGADAFARLSSVAGNGRWDYWVAARRAARQSGAAEGLGPGTFEFYWAQNGNRAGGYVRDAHSLWFQTLAETGYVGLALILALFIFALAGGAVRALRARDCEQRAALGAAVAGLTAFVVIASFEWAWQMAVLPAAAMVLLAVALRGSADTGLAAASTASAAGIPSVRRRGAAVVAGLLGLVAVAIPVAGTMSVRASQAAIRDGRPEVALARAADAERVQPYSASASLQRALVLERLGRLPAAARSARSATADEPTNWKVWLVRSRVEAAAGTASASVGAYRRARTLNPRSPIFAR
ncbi:MAG: hypothetical protein ACR2NB_04975 [Solirubrobacteraceae bacterium]